MQTMPALRGVNQANAHAYSKPARTFTGDFYREALLMSRLALEIKYIVNIAFVHARP